LIRIEQDFETGFRIQAGNTARASGRRRHVTSSDGFSFAGTYNFQSITRSLVDWWIEKQHLAVSLSAQAEAVHIRLRGAIALRACYQATRPRRLGTTAVSMRCYS